MTLSPWFRLHSKAERALHKERLIRKKSLGPPLGPRDDNHNL